MNMTDIHDRPWAPYAPASVVIPVLRRLRGPDVPQKLSREFLYELGVSRHNANLVMGTIEFLGLIDEDGTATFQLQCVQEAMIDEYPGVLAGMIREAYGRVFEVVDPATASTAAITDAFACCRPAAQASRMGCLFRALAQEADLIDGDPHDIQATTSSRKPATIGAAESQVVAHDSWLLRRPAACRGADVSVEARQPLGHFRSDAGRGLSVSKGGRQWLMIHSTAFSPSCRDQAPGLYIGRSLLSFLTGIEDRRMRAEIELARRDGWPILSQSAAPGGYRLAVSYEDALPLLDSYTRRALSLLQTRSQLRFHMARHLHPVQLPLMGGDNNG